MLHVNLRCFDLHGDAEGGIENNGCFRSKGSKIEKLWLGEPHCNGRGQGSKQRHLDHRVCTDNSDDRPGCDDRSPWSNPCLPKCDKGTWTWIGDLPFHNLSVRHVRAEGKCHAGPRGGGADRDLEVIEQMKLFLQAENRKAKLLIALQDLNGSRFVGLSRQQNLERSVPIAENAAATDLRIDCR